jgi:hypothetical protein
MIPLNLSGRQQDFLADVCLFLREWQRKWEWEGQPMTADEVNSRLDDLSLRYDLTPQKLDGLYDLLHRTGANS